MKNFIKKAIDDMKDELCEISDFMYYNPELGNQEYKACEKLSGLLKKYGFEVTKGTADLETAFTAVYDSKKPGPKIAFFCEYDALPEIGHGCGHNIIGVIGAASGIGLSKAVSETGGSVYVFGTPAEESDGAKVYMTDKGVFDGIDFGMMMHPARITQESGYSLAMDAWQFDFHGRPAHAAADPEKGINALDGVIFLFNGINALREHVKSDVRMHGIVHNGGVAANIVPEFASARFYIRSISRAYLNEVVEKVFNIARGAALMSGTTVDIKKYEVSFDDMLTNRLLSKSWVKNMKEELGVTDIEANASMHGSLDMGNVSHRIPSIHAYIGMGDPAMVGHTRHAADLTIASYGHDMIVLGAKSLALTGYDLLTDKELARAVRDEFSKAEK